MPRISQLRARLHITRSRQKGTALVIFTFFIALVGIPMAGLAIDMGVVFWAKAKLSAAVDAAALAAGRSVVSQDTETDNQQTAKTVGGMWFTANFPGGWLGTSVSNPSIDLQPGTNSSQQVTVSASAVVPLYFMRLAGYNSITISASAVSSRRDAFVVFVLDRSGSMGKNNWGNACPVMQQAAINFSNVFAENYDTLSLVTFSTSAGPNADYGPSTTFVSDSPNIAKKINSFSCVGWTNTAQALAVAYNIIKNKGGLKTGLNAIVLFTDGQPNAFTGAFPVMTSALLKLGGVQQDHRYGSYPPKYGLPDYNTEGAVGASGCSSIATITGVLAAAPYTDFSNNVNPQPNGMTEGIYDGSSQQSLSGSAAVLSGNSYKNCNFLLSTSPHKQQIEPRLDIAYLPSTDVNGNALSSGINGYYGVNSNGIYLGPPQVFPSTPANYYAFPTHLRPDLETTGVTAAAINAADYQARQIRSDTTYKPVIYTIGLGGAPDYGIDFTFLERLANDPQSPVYDNTQATGSFAYASDPTQLNDAFQKIASQILQLTR